MVDGATVASRWHARHDPFGIAEAVTGGAVPATVRTCPACGALHRDLLSIRTAVRHAWTPRRPRDLRLDPAAVARLRPVLWRRFLAFVGSSHDTVTRPLALGLTGLGVAGVLAGNVAIGAMGMIGPSDASDGAGASALPERSISVYGPANGPTNESRIVGPNAGPDPLTVVSIAALAAGGSLSTLRRVAARARPLR